MMLRCLMKRSFLLAILITLASTRTYYDAAESQLESQDHDSNLLTPRTTARETNEIVALSTTHTRQEPNCKSDLCCSIYHLKYRLHPHNNVSYYCNMSRDLSIPVHDECSCYVKFATNKANRTWEENSCTGILVVSGDHIIITLRIQLILENLTNEDWLQNGKFKLSLFDASSSMVSRKSVQAKEFLLANGYTWTILNLQGRVLYNITVRLKSAADFQLRNFTYRYATKCHPWNIALNRRSGDKWLKSYKDWRLCKCDNDTSTSNKASHDLLAWNHPSSLPMIAPRMFRNMTMVSFTAEIQENPIIVTAIALTYIGFLMAFILAFRKDIKDRTKPPYIELYDNAPDEKYRYLVVVYTGNRKRAGPTSTVAIQIIGRRSSKVHLLQEYEGEPFLVQGSVTTFVLTTKSSIGDVKMIRLWHHNEGSSPEWYVERLVMQDYETKEAWLFLVNSWLSDHLAGEAKIDITVPAASMKELLTFRSLFSIKFGKYLKERHMWYSSIFMHPWSVHNMTRVRHLACCLLLVFMIMVMTLAFYGTQGSSVIDLGFYSFQWSNIAIGIQSSIICFPVPYAVSCIFWNCRERSKNLNVSLPKLHEEESLERNIDGFNVIYSQHSEVAHPSGHQVSILKMQRQKLGNSHSKKRLLINPLKTKQRVGSFHRLDSETSKVRFRGEDRSVQSTAEPEVQTPSAGKKLNSVGYSLRKCDNSGNITVNEVDPGSIDHSLLPWYGAYLGWAMIISGMVFSTVLTLLYGMAFGVHISRQWAVSVVSGILFSVYIIEPLKAAVLALVAVVRSRKVDMADWIPSLRVPVSIRNYNDKKALADLRRKNPCYKPPGDETLSKSVKRLEKRIFRRRLKDLSIHMVYLCILVLNAVGIHDNRMFHHKNALSNMFQVGSISWGRIKNYMDIYTWLEGPLLDTLYGGYKSHFTDGQLLVISPAVLRQQKFAQEQPCLHASSIVRNSLSCKSRYDVEEIGHLEPLVKKDNIPYLSHDSPWKYTSESPWALPFWGEHDNYHSGGYIAKLGKSRRNATIMLDHLKKNNWIDRHSRLVMMETVLYNVALRFYCYVQMSFEITSRGKVHRDLRLMIMKPHYVTTVFDYITYFSLFALLAIVFYFVYNMANLARESGFSYFIDFWHLLEISTLLSSVGIVVTYLSKANRTDLAMHAIRTGGDSLPLLYAAANLSDVFVALLGYCIFFTMLRTVAIMEGHQHFRLSYATMQIIRYELIGHLVCLVVGFFAFYHSGLLLFRDMLDFSTLVRAAQSVVAYAAGAYMSNLLVSHPLYGGIYCFIFYIVYGKLFVNFFACILENAFRESKLLLRNIKKEDFVKLTRKQIRSLFVLEGRRRAMEEMKAKSDMEKSKEKIYAEVLKIKFARKYGVSLSDQDVDMTHVYE